MVVELECPWCEEALRVEAAELDGEMRCAECAAVFSFAPERPVLTVVSDAA